jgi:hypothetical protein
VIRALVLIMLTLLGGCDDRREHGRASVTVQLPPARPPASAPHFSFSNSAEPVRQGAIERQ